MYFADLPSFLSHLEKDDGLIRVKAIVDPYLETAAIIDRVCKGAGAERALLFEKVKGSQLPLAANLFGSKQRVALALGVNDIEDLASRVREGLNAHKTLASGQALAELSHNGTIEKVLPDAAPCFTNDATMQGLDGLPALHSWPGDGGRYLTLGQVFTRHPDSGRQNCGMYRVQILNKYTALIRCHPGSGGLAHMAAWHAQGQPMAVAIVLGGPPVLTWCAGLSLPEEVSELEFAGYLTGKAMAVTECHDSELRVPASAEVVIQGHILPGEEGTEGPFGNHTGFYTTASPAPVLRVKSVFMREHAVYPCTLVGPPPMENMYLAQAAERVMLPLLQHDFPWIRDIHMPLEGIYHRAVLVSVDAPEITMMELGKLLRQTKLLRNSRLIILLDKDCDLGKASNVYWRFVNSASWSHSVLIDDDKMTIDARTGSRGDAVHPEPDTLNRVIERWRELTLGEM